MCLKRYTSCSELTLQCSGCQCSKGRIGIRKFNWVLRTVGCILHRLKDNEPFKK